jgi:prepilin-type N-terminal cleavage/methylation domain-containing protein
MNASCQHHSRGFSLIELVYVIVVMGLLGALLVPVVHNSLKSYDITRQEVTTLDQTRYAMERMARELREVRFTASQAVAFTSATATSLVFTRRAVDAVTGSEGVTLAQSGSDLTLAYTSLPAPTTGAQLLLEDVGRFALVYLDQTQTAMAISSTPTPEELADVHAVRIELEVNTPDGRKLSRQTVVQLKNRSLL